MNKKALFSIVVFLIGVELRASQEISIFNPNTPDLLHQDPSLANKADETGQLPLFKVLRNLRRYQHAYNRGMNQVPSWRASRDAIFNTADWKLVEKRKEWGYTQFSHPMATLLETCGKETNIALVKLAIKKGASVTVCNRKLFPCDSQCGDCPLALALKSEREDIAAVLMQGKKGANPDSLSTKSECRGAWTLYYKYNGWPAYIGNAFKHGIDPQLLRDELDKAYDINQVDEYGHRAWSLVFDNLRESSKDSREYANCYFELILDYADLQAPQETKRQIGSRCIKYPIPTLAAHLPSPYITPSHFERLLDSGASPYTYNVFWSDEKGVERFNAFEYLERYLDREPRTVKGLRLLKGCYEVLCNRGRRDAGMALNSQMPDLACDLVDLISSFTYEQPHK